jgi:RNA polymerase sigma-70 factor, ECF subfamily
VQDAQRHDLVDAWYRAYADRVLAYLLHRTDPPTAEDVLQEVFVTAYRRAERVREPVLAWLFGTARRVLSNQRRSAARQTTLLNRVGGYPAVPPAVGNPDDAHPDVAAAFAQLSPGDQEILTLTYWYGLTGTEAAAAVGCSLRTYAVRLHRARNRLAGHLDAAAIGVLEGDHRRPNRFHSIGRTSHA